MPFLNSIFSCKSNDTIDDDVKGRMIKMELRIELIEQNNKTGLQRLEDKLDNKFDILNSKIDNIILLLNNK